ncbi:Protein CBG18482 [Caenorhabditis briggsae]|uniref:F-box domain-containing protein n=3 Tax=Caenorhabditis briggsae TaxID=6238 RepID=A0AAE9D761_CAEBR|nr:Protein CBG18482 [Caenorhabditis briggsae]ULT97351.1 hypothetical protein L3Y34_005279 [Caenorhabditis briggsae]CAP35925.2 Protein CBG18482 [Caenorhabditis briggsae]
MKEPKTLLNLSTEVLQEVLKHMEANRRFELAKRIPLMKSLEKSVPLRIDTLVFDDLRIQINDTEYKFGVYKKYDKKEETPEFVEFENSQGGLPNNIDEFGFNDFSNEVFVEEGDVVLTDSEDWQEFCDEQLERNEGERSNMKRIWIQRTIQEQEKQIALLRSSEPQNHFEIQNLQQKLHKSIADLLAFQYRDSGVTSYIPYTQLLITSTRGTHIERFEYSGNIHEAFRCLIAQLFGNRGHPIEVKRFEPNSMILRLPLGVKFQIEGLKFSYAVQNTYENLKDVVEESSYPLEYVEFNGAELEGANLRNQVIREAKEVVISGKLENGKWTPYLEKMGNPKVHVKDGFEKEPIDDLYFIICSWMNNGNFEKRMWTVKLNDEQSGAEILKKLANDFYDEDVKENRYFRIPLDFTTDLKVSKECGDSKNLDSQMIKLEIQHKNFYIESVALSARVIRKSIVFWNFFVCGNL